MVKETKKKSRENFVNKLNKDTPIQDVWNSIKKIKGKKKSAIIQGTNITSAKEITNALVREFYNKSSDNNYNAEFLQTKNRVEQLPLIINEDDAEINAEIKIWEVQNAINELKINKSPGPDNISFEFLKQLPQETVKLIANIFNHIWIKEQFPQSWEEIEIVPILKPQKNKTDPKSYRPIALSNTICKLLEKIVNKRLMWYLEANNLLTTEQSGFRSGRSIIDHILSFVNDAQSATKNKQHMCAYIL